MTLTTTAPSTDPADARPSPDVPTVRSRSGDLAGLRPALRSELIKLSSVRSNKVVLVLSGVCGLVVSFLVARSVFVTDEALNVSEIFVYSTFLTAVLATVSGILLFTSEVHHGTLAGSLTAQPARWVIVAAKAVVAAGFGIVLGAVGMVAGVVGSLLGGLAMGPTSAMASTALWALVFTSLSAMFGLGVGMIVRHSSGAVSGLLIWWLVVENLLWAVLPERVGRFLPYFAGGALLDAHPEIETPEQIAAALTRPQNALVFAGYALIALLAGAVVLHRRETS